MRRIALAGLVVITACSTPAAELTVRRPVAPPIVAQPAPATTVAGDASFPVDILTAPAPNQDGMDALGTFVLKYDAELNCIYHAEEDNNGEPGTGGRVVIQWPFGYTAINQGGKVIVLDDAGTAVAVTGVEFQMAGGGSAFNNSELPGGCEAAGIWYANGGPLTVED